MYALSLAAILLSAEPRFETDVLPLLTKAGCNAGACHGASAGRGGLKLSLFAGNPAGDFDALVRELEGRRINRAKPAQSLIIAKPTGMIDHEGGERFDYDGPEAKLLVEWVAAGTPRAETGGLLREISLSPAEISKQTAPLETRVAVTAHLADGSTRDVTSMSVFTPGDETAVKVAADGRLTVTRPGRHTVIVRYLSQVRPLSITLRSDDKVLDLSKSPRRNWIDDEIVSVLTDLGQPPLPPATDAALLRRASLSLTGRLPGEQETEAYLADKSPKKYEQLVERLLTSEAFIDYWTWRLARQLRVRTGPNDERGTQAFHAWIREQIKNSTPFDKMAKEMLVAGGDSHQNGPANFHRSAADARGEAEYLTEVLLGVRLRCANCHNHPLDRWTQDDYHGLAAVFARLERGRVVRLAGSGEIIHPATGEAALPRIPGERFLAPAGKTADYRGELADWLIDKKSGLFAKAQVNRLWKALFGRGLVEPADDLRETNPATHPRLLDKLAGEFAESGFDLRHMLRLMALSAAFQRQSSTELQPSVITEQFYAAYPRHSLDAEVLLDAIGDVSGVPESFPNVAAGTRAVQLVELSAPQPALSVLGACSRQESCDAAPIGSDPLAQLTTQLHFLNGKLLNERLQSEVGILAEAEKRTTPADKVVQQLYLRAFSRPPSEKEQTFWAKELAGATAEHRQKKLQDLLWAILSSREFTANH
jgi:hypothetical protein